MSLHGTSESFGFTEILKVLADSRKSGRLVVRGGSTEGAFFFDTGQLSGLMGRGAAAISPKLKPSPSPAPSHGDSRKDDGESQGEDQDPDHGEDSDHGEDQDQHQDPGEDRHQDKDPDEDQSSPWPDPAVELAAALLRAPHVAFVFEPGIRWPDSASDRAPVDQLLADGAIRVEEWREVEKIVPSLELRPRLVVQTSSQVILEPDEWRLLTAIDGRLSVSSLARTSGLTPLSACQHLAHLLERELIDLETPPAPRATVAEIVELPETGEAGVPVDGEAGVVRVADDGSAPESVAVIGTPQSAAGVATAAIGDVEAGDVMTEQREDSKGRRWQRRTVRRSA